MKERRKFVCATHLSKITPIRYSIIIDMYAGPLHRLVPPKIRVLNSTNYT